MQRRAFLGGAAALAITPFVGSTLRASANDATPEASPAATPVLPVVTMDDSGAEVTITDVSRIIPLNGDLAEIVWRLALATMSSRSISAPPILKKRNRNRASDINSS